MPIYIGDLLLSADVKPNHVVDIPAIKDINARLPKGTPRSVHALRQKLNLISDRLIVAWAGSYLQARSLMSEMKRAADNGNITLENIRQIVESRDPGDRDDLQFVGTLLTPNHLGDGRVYLQHFEYCIDCISMGDVQIYAGGSGANDLLRIVPHGVVSNPLPDCQPESPEHYDWALAQAMAVSGALIGHETTTAENIPNWWGGGIEVASFVEGKFQKLTDVLHTVWRAIKIDSQRYEICFVPKLIKYDYFEDALVAQTFSISINSANHKAVVEDHSYRMYTPILKGRHSYDLSRFEPRDLRHTTLCCYVLMEPPDPSLGNLVRVYYDAMGDTPFRFAKSADNFVFSFRGDLLNNLESDVSRATGLPAKLCQIGS
ncbi:MAG TPA: hypothetical protein VNZ48_01065 [Xanthobacteraceae bacterium]|jgi:hypothetical protein|nr:hypothetical protein [Xanthobacteraceae bacterium]